MISVKGRTGLSKCQTVIRWSPTLLSWSGSRASPGKACLQRRGGQEAHGDGGGRRSPAPLRVAYTGDTSPCENVIASVRGVDVLIHEATFDSTMEAEAAKFGHSTSVGAARVAKEASVRKLILTHVSTRYEGYEAKALEEEARQVFPDTVLAWDLARFALKA